MSQIFFRKDHEDAEIVRYAFGADFEHLARSLTITKADRAYVPDDGAADREFRKATWGIAGGRGDGDPWPERGSHTSG